MPPARRRVKLAPMSRPPFPPLDAEGTIQRREASLNDVPITEAERWFRWPLGPRPAEHPGLTELGL